MNRKKVVLGDLHFREIDANRWNTLLGEDKTTAFQVLPYTGLGVIIVNDRLKAVSIITAEDLGESEIIRNGQFEVIEG